MTKSTVLVVDDSPYLHKLVRAYVEPDPIIVHSAYDGDAALSAAVSLRPSLILLDVDLPSLDGFEVCRRLKANSATEAIPVMFVTADMSLGDKVKGLDLGAIDYITKPFKPEELRARVRSALRAKHQLDKTAMVDGLTGLWNAAFFESHLPSQLSLARRSGRPLACIIGDVDELRKINEEHGHATGDEVLREVARIFLSHCRAEDAVFHYGGGKFVALMSGTDWNRATHLVDRIRSEIQRQLRHYGKTELGATCSFGVADTQGNDNETLIDRAEAALYQAKQVGRNQVSISQSTIATDMYALG